MFNMIRVVAGSNNGNPKTTPPALHGNAHNIVTSMEHKFSNIDQCKKGLRLERCNKVNIDIVRGKKDNNVYCRLEGIEDLK
jgi:hypothetical protein